MPWNPLDKLRRAIGIPRKAEHPPAGKPPEPKGELGGDAGLPGFKELQKKGLLGSFFRRWKDPAFAKMLSAVAASMKADGVDVKDQNAVKDWIEKNKGRIESGDLLKPSGPVQHTFVKTGPDIGRNDPCPCGSGKKYKKCCGKG